MSVVTKRFQNSKSAFAFLEAFAYQSNDTIVFRGHQSSKYRLVNTWQRYSTVVHESWNSDIDETLTKYEVGLERLGLESFNQRDRFEAMEHGRHHGVPTPCLDFTYSPYVALFFAFNGVRAPRRQKKLYSVVYALNVLQLAIARARELVDPSADSNAFHKAVRHFQWPQQDDFKNMFPPNTLQFIPFPGSRNKRMQRQLGCLLYDTLEYDLLGSKDLEDYIGKKIEPSISDGATLLPSEPILTKVLINQAVAHDVFARLELMNITGGQLFDSADGVALDVKNAYNYTPKFSYLRDVDAPPLDDTKP